MSEPRFALELLGGDGGTTALPERGVLVVGSDPARAGLVLSGQGIDAAHCALGRAQGAWAIKDLGSAYGTTVNGESVTTRRLQLDDLIVVGSRRLRVVDADAAPSAPPGSDPAPRPDAPGRPDSPGRPGHPERIGGYRIERLLGAGGGGQVFLAVQESLNRYVALKVLAPRLADDPDFVRRFQREARAAAALNHPNVVVVHDVGSADGAHYLSMEYMPGGTLEDRLNARGALPWREVLEVLRDAASGLAYAEASGVVHRDVKPANLMRAENGVVKLADLGLASAPGESADDSGSPVYGTPHFIAPEQARGESVDHRADLYSLGASAYRLLSGRTPFEGDSTREILRGHLHREPRPLVELVPGLPGPLDALVADLLAKAPDERPQSASEVLRRIDELRAAADGGAAPSAARRSVLPWILIAGVASAALAVVWLATREGPQGERAPLAGPTDGPAPDSASRFDDGPVDGPARDPGARAGTTGPIDGAAEEDDGAGFYEAPERELTPFDVAERDLEILDLEARLAYRDLPSAKGPERLAALRALVEAYDGTDTALAARDEVADLEAELARRREERERTAELVRNARAGLMEFAGWPPAAGARPRVGDALRKLEGYRPPTELASSAGFEEARRSLAAEVVAAGDQALRAELARARGFVEEGDFPSVRAVVDDLVPRYDLPAYEAGTEPEGYGALRAGVAEIALLVAQLPELERRFAKSRLRLDRLRVAAAFGPGSGCLEELSELRFALLEARAREALGELYGETSRRLAGEIAEQAALAAEAPGMLADAFAADEWRRRSVPDPRSETNALLVRALSPDTVWIEDAEAPIPFAEFAADAGTLLRLFDDRLRRDYRPREREAIAALLSLAASAQAAREAREALAGAGGPHAPLAPFRLVEDWLALEEGPSDLARATQTAQRLQAVLADVERGAWTRAERGLLELLTGEADTLLVALLSDGRELPEPGSAAADTAEDAPAESPGPDAERAGER